eukprot:CAMPEP_0171849304 /NCGR_PEP_ID=MMETSP0992-20121227/19582_1 /TAXON_ID=483369 /ORGANISM="non described non described, Strain CCMP2098" /LENGTH=155 /DNA_ID=CAMNT_0012468459 /DNA_START=196 /DNA_END=665 /DNA_ORIENTATION=+
MAASNLGGAPAVYTSPTTPSSPAAATLATPTAAAAEFIIDKAPALGLSPVTMGKLKSNTTEFARETATSGTIETATCTAEPRVWWTRQEQYAVAAAGVAGAEAALSGCNNRKAVARTNAPSATPSVAVAKKKGRARGGNSRPGHQRNRAATATGK